MISRILLTALLTGLVSLSSAGEWTNSGEVVGVYVDLRAESERILLRHSAGYKNPDNACRQDNEYYELKSNAAYSKEAYSLLLSAEAAKMPVRFYLEGCGPTSWPLVVLVDTIHTR